jgi:hypothetical protein
MSFPRATLPFHGKAKGSGTRQNDVVIQCYFRLSIVKDVSASISLGRPEGEDREVRCDTLDEMLSMRKKRAAAVPTQLKQEHGKSPALHSVFGASEGNCREC